MLPFRQGECSIRLKLCQIGKTIRIIAEGKNEEIVKIFRLGCPLT
jgi:hypothetical protein